MNQAKTDNYISNPRRNTSESLNEISERRYSRRAFLKTSVAAGVAASGLSACSQQAPQIDQVASSNGTLPNTLSTESSFKFTEIEHGFSQHHAVAPDHQAKVLIRWGDPLFASAPEFELDNQSAAAQAQQFGYNNDYVGFLALPLKENDEASQRALLFVNHEYPIHGLMFPGYGTTGYATISAEQVAISQAATGNSIVEVMMKNQAWEVDRSSKYNRRITSNGTEMKISGPAAGHSRMQTHADPSGRKVIGTMNNCAGGVTPWGTFVTCEENINYHFGGSLANLHAETTNHQRMNVPANFINWSKHDSRFDISVEPNEPNRFGWVVEVDPLDAQSTPIKRTALGRFKHEGSENVIAKDGRLVVYMGDDQLFEYLYKFVSRDKVDLNNPQANKDLLDHGVLYVAKFEDDGSMQWHPLNMDNPAVAAQFDSQADVLIETRRAADAVAATPMDRPEDVVPNANKGKAYVMLTNNLKRKQSNAVNPRAVNTFGHILEVSEAGGDMTATHGRWDILVKCGDPQKPNDQAQWNSQTSANGWFASPDNGALDPSGRLWVSTDQGSKHHLSGTNDGLWAMETDGDVRGTGKMFFRAPNGAEVCGPVFADDGESLFLAIQHPGDQPQPGQATIKDPSTRWPDFDAKMPPRPSLMVIQRKGGGKIA